MRNITFILEQNSKLLQSSTPTAKEACTCIEKVKIYSESIRSDEEFKTFMKGRMGF